MKVDIIVKDLLKSSQYSIYGVKKTTNCNLIYRSNNNLTFGRQS
jgi:hypothetical protein